MSNETQNIIPDSTLYIDVGNSSIKTACQVGMEWRQPVKYPLIETTALLQWIDDHADRLSLVLISSVVQKVSDALTAGIGEGKCRVLMASDIPMDLLDYQTPETLGIDRFLACYGAVVHTSRPVVVIDAGSACTIDYMSADGVYRGGVIMPGIAAMEQALKVYAPVLPGVPRVLPDDWPGRSTRASLQWGLTGTFVDAIRASLRRYEKKFGAFELILTGGDAGWLAKELQEEAKVRPMLVFEGMKRFLENHL